MAPTPEVSDFPSFQQLASSSASGEVNCLWYLPKDARRCKHRINQDDRAKAFELGKTISRSASHHVRLEQLMEFAQLKCCNQAKHRQKLTDSRLLLPLAQRWLSEFSQLSPMPSSAQPLPAPSLPIWNAVPDPDIQLPTQGRRIQTRSRSQQPSEVDLQSSPHPTTHEPSYSSANIPTFRPHIVQVSQSVSLKLQQPLKSTTPTRGTIYLFTRSSSLDHIKIGYTKHTAQYRLNQWAKTCGYTPILLAKFNDVPHMRKVETLIHFQLADQWRVEVHCERCHKQHREWFEIGQAEATVVAGQWVRWMQEAEPYDTNGKLKEVWKRELWELEREGLDVTAERLLEIHERSLQQDVLSTATVIEEDIAEPVNQSITSLTTLLNRPLFTETSTGRPDRQSPRLHARSRSHSHTHSYSASPHQSHPQTQSGSPLQATTLAPTQLETLTNSIPEMLAALRIFSQVSQELSRSLLESSSSAQGSGLTSTSRSGSRPRRTSPLLDLWLDSQTRMGQDTALSWSSLRSAVSSASG